MYFINEDNISDYAFVNTDTLKFPVKAVCVEFHGYTDATMFSESPAKVRLLAEIGLLVSVLGSRNRDKELVKLLYR